MFTEEDLKTFPWHIVKKITFRNKEVTVEFRSGGRLSATPPDKKTYTQFQQEAKKNLKEEQIQFGDIEK